MKFLIAAWITSGASLFGGTLISNYHLSTGSDVPYPLNVPRESIGIVTGSSPALVTSITLRLQASTPGLFKVDLFTASTAAPYYPSVSIASFETLLVGAKGDYVFDAPDNVVLSANTRYWFVSEPISGAGWKFTEANFSLANQPGGHLSDFGATIYDYAYTPDYLGSMTMHSGSDYISVAAIAIPEPSTCAIAIGAAALGFAGCRRRRVYFQTHGLLS
jgi:hypothetical protein